MVQVKTRNRQAHHNLSIKIVKHIPTSSKIANISIQYTYKKKRVRRTSPVELPMNVFEKLPNGCGSIKKNFLDKYPVQLKWINKFNGLKNNLEVRMKEGVIDYEHAFKMLRNDYETQIISECYPKYAEEENISKSVKENVQDKIITIQNHFLKLGYKQYGVLEYQHFQNISDRKKIKNVILTEIESIDSGTKKKYFSYLNQMAQVHPTFTEAEKTPFNVRIQHSTKPPKPAVSHRQLMEGLLNIGDNLYNLEAYLWWLYSFCLRGVDTCDIVCMNESMIESNLGAKRGKLREFYAWNYSIVNEDEIPFINRLQGDNEEYDKEYEKMYGEIFKCNDEKFYLVGKRVKNLHRGKDNRVVVKILYNTTPVLLIHKMLKKVISIIHPDLAYKGRDSLRLYNIDYKTSEGKKTWANRRGNMTKATKRMFGGSLKQTRHTFSTIVSDILSVNFQQAEKQLSTSLGHANNKSQRHYVNPNQDKMDIIHIEAIERLGIREIVENLIKICNTKLIKTTTGEEEPMLNESLLKFSPLTVNASWWDWSKELRFQELKRKSASRVKLVQNKKGKWVTKDVKEPNPELEKMIAERRLAFIEQRKKDVGIA